MARPRHGPQHPIPRSTRGPSAYTGGKPQKPTGTPLKVGYVNQESYFPEATIGLDAAVAYANAELNGADGHPIQVVSCQVSTPQDGAKCGAQMANDPSIALVFTGTLINGNTELYNALNGKKAVIIGNGVTPTDFTTPAGEAFFAGAPGVLQGMVKFTIAQFHPQTVALLAADNDAGHAGAQLIMTPALENGGAQVKTVFVPDQATAPQVASAMQAVGADKADVFESILTLQNCINMYDAIKQLGIKPTVVTTGLCFGTPMTQHLQDVGDSGTYPDGWYFGDYGYSYFLPSTTPNMAGVRHEHLPREGAAVRQAGARCQHDRVQRLRRTDVRQRPHRRQVHQRARRAERDRGEARTRRSEHSKDR